MEGALRSLKDTLNKVKSISELLVFITKTIRSVHAVCGGGQHWHTPRARNAATLVVDQPSCFPMN